MATFLDSLGVLNFFAPLFSAVLVFAVVFALLVKTKILGESMAIQGIIAAVLGLLVLITPDAVKLVTFISPWFVVAFIFLILLFLIFRIYGLSEGDIAKYIQTDRGVNWAAMAVALIIVIAGIFNVFGERALDITQEGETGEGFEGNLFSVLFDRQILGMLLVLAVAVFTVAFLGGGLGSDIRK